MPTTTLAVLKTRVLGRAQMDAEDSGAAEIVAHINAGWRYVRETLLANRQAGLLIETTPSTFATVAGTQTTDLPATLEALEGVDLQIGGTWYPAVDFNFGDRHLWGQSRAWSVTEEGRINARFTILGDKIFWQDPPDAVYSGRFWYVAQFVDLAVDADTVDLRGHMAAVVDFAAQKCLEDDELDAGHLERSVQRWEAKVKATARRRARGSHGKARDVTGATANLRAMDRETIP